MVKYIIGFFKYFFYRRISFFALVDNRSTISKKASVGRFVQFYKSSIGDYSYIGSRSEVVCTEIGKFCSIARNCSIGMANHSTDYLSTSPIFTEKNNATTFSWTEKNCYKNFNQVKIGNDVWIGKNVLIVGKVTIGSGAVIGAGAIVTKDVPPYSVVAGVPAKIIKYRFNDDIIQKLLEIKWWNLPESIIKKQIHFFQTNDISIENLQQIELP
jgi:acetyltransferase-like isoleucine patch superfamily enzyme